MPNPKSFSVILKAKRVSHRFLLCAAQDFLSMIKITTKVARSRGYEAKSPICKVLLMGNCTQGHPEGASDEVILSAMPRTQAAAANSYLRQGASPDRRS